MNEHFLKALINVGFEFTNDPEYGQVLENFTMRDAEKFAELIVRECAQFVEDKFDFIGDEIIVKEKMLEHFGVEE